MRTLITFLCVLLTLAALVSARPKDYDYLSEMVESTEHPGVAIDREVPRHKYGHHHHKKHHHTAGDSKDFLKTNRLGKLRKYFEDHYL